MPAPDTYSDTIRDIKSWPVEMHEGKPRQIPISMTGRVDEIRGTKSFPSQQGGDFKVMKFRIKDSNGDKMLVDWSSPTREIFEGDNVKLSQNTARGSIGTYRHTWEGNKRVQIKGEWQDDPSGAKEWVHMIRCSSTALEVVGESLSPEEEAAWAAAPKPAAPPPDDWQKPAYTAAGGQAPLPPVNEPWAGTERAQPASQPPPASVRDKPKTTEDLMRLQQHYFTKHRDWLHERHPDIKDGDATEVAHAFTSGICIALLRGEVEMGVETPTEVTPQELDSSLPF